MVINVECLHSQAAKSSGYGVTVGEDIIYLVPITNTEWAANQDWCGEFRDVMRNIRQKCAYNKVHNVDTCADIMKHIAEAD